MDEGRIDVSGVTLGTATVHGAEQPLVIIESQMTVPEPVLWMLPMGRLGMPMLSCFRDGGDITCYPLADDLTFVDTPWVFGLADDVRDVLESSIRDTNGRVALSVYSDGGAPVLLEMSGAMSQSLPLDAEEHTLFRVGLWLAASQLAAESGSGFGHVRVAAGLASISPFASEALQQAVTRACAALTMGGRARMSQTVLPAVVERDIVHALIVDEESIDLLFSRFGPAATTVACVWILAALARVLVERGAANHHSVATLLAEWIGGSNPWWMWRATTIALMTYEDSIPVSVLESRADGAAGALFWWLHESAGMLRGMSRKRNRHDILGAIRRAELRPGDDELPLLDFVHLLMSEPKAGVSRGICGEPACLSCQVAATVLQAPWDRSTLARCAVWFLILMGDIQASWRRYRPGDAAWARARQGMMSEFTESVGSRLLGIQGKAA